MILDSYHGSKFYNSTMFLFFEKNEKEGTYETCSLWDSFFLKKKYEQCKTIFIDDKTSYRRNDSKLEML